VFSSRVAMKMFSFVFSRKFCKKIFFTFFEKSGKVMKITKTDATIFAKTKADAKIFVKTKTDVKTFAKTKFRENLLMFA
jgi:hypothetical protein